MIDSWPPRLRRFVNLARTGIAVGAIDGLYRNYLAECEGDETDAADDTVRHLKRTIASRRVVSALPEKRTSF